MIWFIFIGLTLLSWLASRNVQRKFKQYSTIPTTYGQTGRQVAEQMLADFDIRDVTVQMVRGTLTDHYNPTNKTLNLSPEVYNGTNVAAAAVAAHECGHAVQHATAYRWLTMRSLLVPAVNFSNHIVSWVLLIGILLVQRFPGILLAGIVLFAVTTLFTFITLPVEINASRRALAWMDGHNITSPESHRYATDALRAAAMTYVMAALTSLATLMYYVVVYLSGRD
ncbi:MAG: zinc metallopeptidase [Bacteroidales bacterium]|nr:zinc metallopeptidase [Bacteroidales bacterium]